ncbi:hypothetical protein NTHI1209_01183 [Haemophilus influenzae]|uniref:Uncharacterized protein n=1 Tax=Haemophilus influenzae TaxID=727 RepID=A0A158SXI2_HAEIF|nr:hypothetical protein NTHI1209_01183 [Haemophilus influenzae]
MHEYTPLKFKKQHRRKYGQTFGTRLARMLSEYVKSE